MQQKADYPLIKRLENKGSSEQQLLDDLTHGKSINPSKYVEIIELLKQDAKQSQAFCEFIRQANEQSNLNSELDIDSYIDRLDHETFAELISLYLEHMMRI
jgi:hypothetical protein